MGSEIELKPCPFCGGEAFVRGPDTRTLLWVECSKCAARSLWVKASHGGNASEVVAAWNKRAPAQSQADQIERLTRERDEAISEADRIKRVTTRFPEHMARIASLKNEDLPERSARLRDALSALPSNIHKYQWVADERPVFGDKYIRSVAGDDGCGMGRQAIASIPSHLDGVAEFIAAACPDAVAMLLGDWAEQQALREAAEQRVQKLREALDKPFAMLFLEGRNEHGTHVLPIPFRSMEDAFLQGRELADMAEDIMAEAERIGFSVCDAVWTQFRWVDPQVGDEGRIELAGYWEFAGILPELSAHSTLAPEADNG